MQEDSHNYKALAISYDPSFQYLKGKEIFHREGNTCTQWDQETWPESKAGFGAELQREVAQESTSHWGTVLVQGWSEHGSREHQEHLTHYVSPSPNSISPSVSQVTQLHFASKIKLLCQQLKVTEPLGVPATFAFIYPRLRQHAEGQPQKASL